MFGGSWVRCRSLLTPTLKEIETAVHLLRAVPARSDSRIACVSQCWIFAAAQNEISEVIADLVPLTAAKPTTANSIATITCVIEHGQGGFKVPF